VAATIKQKEAQPVFIGGVWFGKLMRGQEEEEEAAATTGT